MGYPEMDYPGAIRGLSGAAYDLHPGTATEKLGTVQQKETVDGREGEGTAI